MKDMNQSNHQTSRMIQREAFSRTRDYFLGESLKPTENIPDLLAENRKTALGLAESIMGLMDIIAGYFGIPTMDLVMNSLPEVSLQLGADGVREKAAARTYLDLRGAVPLADICKGTYAYSVPTLHCVAEEMRRRERFAKYLPHDPLIKRIFGDPGDGNGHDGTGENDATGEDESDEGSAESESDGSTTGDAPPGT